MKIDKSGYFEGEKVALDYIDNRKERLPLSQIIERVADTFGEDIIAVKRRYFRNGTKPSYVRQFTNVVMDDWKKLEPERIWEGKEDDFILQPRIAVIGGSAAVSLHSLLLRSRPPFLRAG